jgi:hypothetical protein
MKELLSGNCLPASTISQISDWYRQTPQGPEMRQPPDCRRLLGWDRGRHRPASEVPFFGFFQQLLKVRACAFKCTKCAFDRCY